MTWRQADLMMDEMVRTVERELPNATSEELVDAAIDRLRDNPEWLAAIQNRFKFGYVAQQTARLRNQGVDI